MKRKTFLRKLRGWYRTARLQVRALRGVCLALLSVMLFVCQVAHRAMQLIECMTT
jgi:hypothetical protein